VKRPPKDIVRDNIRLTVQPFDAPDGAARLEKFCEQMDSESLLLFSTDFPHWHYDGTDALPVARTSPLARKILHDNPLETYARLREDFTGEAQA
jgi:predicted TIM-barrel fold metal-dependent hydrolase